MDVSFKVLVSTAFIRIEDMTDDIWLSYKATRYENFGEACSIRPIVVSSTGVHHEELFRVSAKVT